MVIQMIISIKDYNDIINKLNWIISTTTEEVTHSRCQNILNILEQATKSNE